MVHVELRRAVSADGAAIRELTRAAYAKWVPLIGREPKPMGADYDAALRTNRFDLLYVDDVLAGLIETIDQGDRLLVENVAVIPAFQGQGWGSKLMAFAEEMASSLGRQAIWLYTNKRFRENIKLYQKLGYLVDREVRVDAETVRVDMSKSLATHRLHNLPSRR